MSEQNGQTWEILVPKYFNDGTEVPEKHHHRWDDFVRSLTGGLTILKKAKGTWVADTGEVFREEMIPVRITCDETTIRAIAAFTIKHYDQLAVKYDLVSLKSVILHRSQIE